MKKLLSLLALRPPGLSFGAAHGAGQAARPPPPAACSPHLPAKTATCNKDAAEQEGRERKALTKARPPG